MTGNRLPRWFQHALKCTDSRQTQRPQTTHTMCHRAEPIQTDQSTEHGEATGDRKSLSHKHRAGRHGNKTKDGGVVTCEESWVNGGGDEALLPCSCRAIRSHGYHGYYGHHHYITTVPRLEKHAAPFWASLLAAWRKERRK